MVGSADAHLRSYNAGPKMAHTLSFWDSEENIRLKLSSNSMKYLPSALNHGTMDWLGTCKHEGVGQRSGVYLEIDEECCGIGDYGFHAFGYDWRNGGSGRAAWE
jgi:hypothetical protein